MKGEEFILRRKQSIYFNSLNSLFNNRRAITLYFLFPEPMNTSQGLQGSRDLPHYLHKLLVVGDDEYRNSFFFSSFLSPLPEALVREVPLPVFVVSVGGAGPSPVMGRHSRSIPILSRAKAAVEESSSRKTKVTNRKLGLPGKCVPKRELGNERKDVILS